MDNPTGARTKVSMLWTSVILDGELPARIKIVKGEATLRMFGLDAPVPGVFEPEDIVGVISALDQQLEDIEEKYLALPVESFEDQCRGDNYGLISDSELEEQIKSYERLKASERRGNVISMKTRKSI